MESISARSLRKSVQDPEAFGPFYDRHFRDVLAFFVRRSGDADAGLDLAAETFAQAFLSRRRFRGSTDGEAAAWLFTIARRQLGRYHRKGRADRRAMERLALERPNLDAESRDQLSELAEFGDLREDLALALEQLSPDGHEALRLRVLEELSFREVAQRLDISECAARKRVSRALSGIVETIDHQLPQEVLP